MAAIFQKRGGEKTGLRQTIHADYHPAVTSRTAAAFKIASPREAG